jgi:dihydroxyacetone kinase-like protein
MSAHISSKDIISVIEESAKNMSAEKDVLISLDQVIGDGDLGITMEKGFTAAAATVKELVSSAPSEIFMKAGMALINNAPSTMGTLMGSGLMRGGKALAGKNELDASDMRLFLTSFTQGIADRGKAKPGEKTLLDILGPAIQSMENYQGEDCAEMWEEAEKGALAGIEAAKLMESQHGKAAVFREKTRGLEDPGGRAAYIFIKSVAAALRKESN